MRRRTMKTVIIALAISFVVAVVIEPRLLGPFYGLFFKAEIIEPLENPVGVEKWVSDGLILADGRLLPLPGVSQLPERSGILKELTRRGVEIGGDGRVYGLIKIHYWCGTTRMPYHLARMDIADVLIFLRIGESTLYAPDMPTGKGESGGMFYEELGWNVSEMVEFRFWLSYKHAYLKAQEEGTTPPFYSSSTVRDRRE